MQGGQRWTGLTEGSGQGGRRQQPSGGCRSQTGQGRHLSPYLRKGQRDQPRNEPIWLGQVSLEDMREKPS